MTKEQYDKLPENDRHDHETTMGLLVHYLRAKLTEMTIPTTMLPPVTRQTFTEIGFDMDIGDKVSTVYFTSVDYEAE